MMLHQVSLILPVFLTLNNAFLHYMPGLALNPDKSDAILFGTDKRAVSLPAFSAVDVAGTIVPLTDHIKLHGDILDKRLSMDHHVANLCKACLFHIRALRHIRPAVNDDTAKTIASSLVSCRLDYANSVLYGTSLTNIRWLRRVQNGLARVVARLPTRSRTTPTLKELHWLPITHRIDYKLATLTYKVNVPPLQKILLCSTPRTTFIS